MASVTHVVHKTMTSAAIRAVLEVIKTDTYVSYWGQFDRSIYHIHLSLAREQRILGIYR